MLFSNANPRSPQATGSEFPIILFGRFMRDDRSEHACRVKELDLRHAVFHTDVEVCHGEHIVAYLDDIGRIEGDVELVEEGQFVLGLRLTPAGRERLQKKLEWVEAKARGEGIEKRRYERYRPKETKSCVVLEDGRRYPCEVIDISVSGASVRSSVLPAIGTPVTLGKTRGRVVRHHGKGFAIEFFRLLPEDDLRQRIG